MAGPLPLADLPNLLAGPAENLPWWKKIPPNQRDWWMRRLNAMPHADGSFQDQIFQRPSAPGTETLDFDRNTIHPDWLRLR